MKKVLVATIKGLGIKEETRSFDSFTSSIEAMRDWLLEHKITHIAMESTGVYWKPVFNVLEEYFDIILVNARHIKNVPGHKTDKKDSKWISKLLISGLLKGSFIPPRPIRELRDLTRYRRKIVGQIPNNQMSNTPLAIKGTEGVVINYAKCCCPIPGDPIIGIFNPGRGIIVHRENCKNLQDYSIHNLININNEILIDNSCSFSQR